MPDEYAIIVSGPQSCGNHLVAEIVRRCMQAEETLRADDPRCAEHLGWKKLVLWGATPCGQRAGWDWLPDALFAVQKRPHVRFVIPMRSWPAAAKSAVNHHHVADMTAGYESFQRACRTIFGALNTYPVPFHIVSYEGLYQAWDIELASLAGFLGVEPESLAGLPFKYANPQRWAELMQRELGPNGQC